MARQPPRVDTDGQVSGSPPPVRRRGAGGRPRTKDFGLWPHLCAIGVAQMATAPGWLMVPGGPPWLCPVIAAAGCAAVFAGLYGGYRRGLRR